MKHSKKLTAKQKRDRREVKRITEYLVSGGAYFWSGYLAFFVFIEPNWTLFPAKILADVVGWVINYTLQRYWVFNNASLSKHKTEVTSRYIFITLVDFLIDYWILVSQLKTLGLTLTWANFYLPAFLQFGTIFGTASWFSQTNIVEGKK